MDATAARDAPGILPPQPPDNAPLIDWVLWHAEVGRITEAWNVFPCAPGQKKPLYKGWQDTASCDPDSVKGMWQRDPNANIGLAINPDFVAVDVDNWDAFKKLEDEHCEFPITYEQRSPSGGVHYVCTTILNTGNKTGSLPKGIDIRGHSGYIVGAGSVRTEKGKETGRWSVEASKHPNGLPGWFEGYLTGRFASTDKPQKGNRTKRKTPKDGRRMYYGEPMPWDEKHANRLVDFVMSGNLIKDYEGPYREGERDNLTCQIFAEAKNRMIHPDVMLEAVTVSGIDGGLDDDERGTVKRKMQSAYFDGKSYDNYGAKVSAYWLPNHVFQVYKDGKPTGYLKADPVEWKAANPKRLPYAFPGDPTQGEATGGGCEEVGQPPASLVAQSFAQVLKKVAKPVVEIIPGRVEKGVVNFLSGPGGSHKSRLALQYCLCVQAGEPIFGNAPEPGISSVYVSAEDGEDEIIRRTHQITRRLNLSPEAIRDAAYLDRCNLDNALARMHEGGGYELTAFYSQLGEYLINIPGHKFLVLDSAYDFVRFEGSSKINEDAVNAFIKEILGGFCRDTNSTLLVPWHPSYAGQERGDASGWSVAWHNAPRVRDSISREKDSTSTFELKAVKRNHGAMPDPITLYYSDGALLPRGQLEQYEQKAELEAACVEVAILCAEKGIPITKQRKIGGAELDRLRERVEVGPNNREVKDILNRAVLTDRLVYVRGDKYQTAGYYPADRATDLSKGAKAAKTKAKTKAKTRAKTEAKTEDKTR